jgi:hypothetical protein
MLYREFIVDYFKNLTEHVHCLRGRKIYSFLIRGVPIKFSCLSVSVYVLYTLLESHISLFSVWYFTFLWFSDPYLKTTKKWPTKVIENCINAIIRKYRRCVAHTEYL